MHRVRLSCIVVVAAFLATVASAGDAPVVDSVRFRSITVEHGLSQATVRTLLQDPGRSPRGWHLGGDRGRRRESF
jgi:hypothetical protein